MMVNGLNTDSIYSHGTYFTKISQYDLASEIRSLVKLHQEIPTVHANA